MKKNASHHFFSPVGLNGAYSVDAISLVLFLKLVVTISVVITLSIVAERVSTSVAGVLSGYPLGVAIVLFFYGWEAGPDFAAQSAVYTMPGLITTQAFVYFYYHSSRWWLGQHPVVPSIIAISGFLVVGWGLQHIRFNLLWAAITPITSIFFFVWLFRKLPRENIQQPVSFSHRVFALRAGLAAVVIVLITGVGKFLGPGWAGVLAAFPSTLFPLLVIVHLTYDPRHVYTIIKNFPLGLGSIIIYALIVTAAYPGGGIFVGTLLAFGGATFYLILLQKLSNLKNRGQKKARMN